MIVTGDMVRSYVADAIGEQFEPPFNAIGEMRRGRMIAGIVLNGWSAADVNLSVACEPPGLSRRLLRFAAAYVWGERGCERVTIETGAGRVIDLAQRLGGRIEGLKRNRYGAGRDAVIIGILKEDWAIR